MQSIFGCFMDYTSIVLYKKGYSFSKFFVFFWITNIREPEVLFLPRIRLGQPPNYV